ncbi:MAG TPA: alpha/beta hydrolase [Candidatus Acidoferrales bacterium]|nr:alpha/beta hydrolase [Candidatus Acidoferrales bacterium]
MMFITDDGVRLHYLDEGQGLPVLLLHAFPLNADSFRPQLAALSGRFRFIVPDHRGFARSQLGSGPTEMDRLARDALGILDSLKIQQAVIGGVSMGGYATMALLRRDPARARALLLVDTQARADDEQAKLRRGQTAREVLEKGVEVLVDSLLPKLLAPNAPLATRNAVSTLIRSNRPEGVAAALHGMATRPDSKDILVRFAGPVLIVVGEHDELTPADRAKEMKALLKSAQLAVLPGAGHLSNQETPKAFNRVLEEFLSSL